jgi:formylglycine-generating enzyme required for sulfatase activity
LAGREHLAINCVTFQQARRYCEWRGGRLPLRSEWELAAEPEHAGLGVADLIGGLSEWTTEPATGTSEATRERAVVLGGGLATGVGTAGTLTRLYMNANAQGRSVGFRCVVRADTAPVPPMATNREPSAR